MRGTVRRGTLALAASLCVLVARRIEAQRVAVASREVAARPGSSVTIAVDVPSGAPALAVEVPAGWRRLLGGEAGAGETTRLVTIAVPAAAAAGTHVVKFRGAGGADSALVRVVAVRRVTIRVIAAQEVAAAGDLARATFLVTNEGNAPASLRLVPWNADGFVVQATPATVALAPLAAREVVVTMRTRPAARERVPRIALLARAGVDDSVLARGSVDVRVTPRGGDDAGAAPTLPLVLTARSPTFASDPTEAGSGSLELAGGGSLAGREDDRLDVLLRRTGARTSLFSERDEYRLAWRHGRVDVRGGDISLPLTALTQSWRPLFGGALSAGAGPLTATALAARDRRGSGERRAQGMLELRFPRVTFGGVLLASTGRDTARTWSTTARVTPTPWSALEGEFALSRARSEGTARRLRATVYRPWLSLAATQARGDSDFVGPWSGARRGTADLALRAPRGYGLEAHWSSERMEPGRTARARPPSSASGAELAATTPLVEIGVRHREREVILLGAPSGGEETGALIRAGRSLSRRGLDATLDVGRFTAVTGVRSPYTRATGRALLALPGGASAVASLGYVEGRGVDSWLPMRRLDGQVTLALDLGKATRLQLAAREQLPLDGRPGLPASIDLRVDRWLPGRQQLTLRARSASYGIAGIPERRLLTLEYGIPLGIPLPARSARGSVAGRVYDAETGAPLAGARVLLADRALLTDGDGRFVFEGVAPGVARVRLDRRDAGAGRLVVAGGDDGEGVVAVQEGARATVEMPVARAGAVAGVVEQYRALSAPDGTSLDSTAADGVARGIVLVLRRGGEERAARTDAEGRFAFDALSPGRWMLAAVPASLPAEHYLAQDSVELEVAPGSARELRLRVLPRRRAVTVVAEAELSLGGKVVERTRPPDPGTYAPRSAASRGGVRVPAWLQGYYTVTRWDVSLADIALKVYGDADLWPKIWVASRDRMTNPAELRPGVRLRVPLKAPLTAAEIAERDKLSITSF